MKKEKLEELKRSLQLLEEAVVTERQLCERNRAAVIHLGESLQRRHPPGIDHRILRRKRS